MLFNSFEFLIFFPVVTAIYFAVPLRARWVLLLAASSIFYMAFIPKYVLIIYGTIVVDYFAGRMIEGAQGPRRRTWLVASLVANIGALAVFKYYNFFIDNVNEASGLLGVGAELSHWDVILPIGLSFHTFQAMSYTIEVYRGNQKAERNFIVYALYVLFYPQLVAGPIERPQNILHQLRVEHTWDPVRAVDGLRLMLWGFFKKVVVADRLAAIVDAVYADPDRWPGPVLALATVAFAFQIYADFSGYSDIAIGAARVMGINLMTNFRQPYVSRSVSEFWTRWHISLSTWFRDYLYIPLGGSRVGPWRHRFNLLATFLVSGLWHGANWTYLVWGGLNGMFLIVERELKLDRRRAWWGLPLTFALICVTWIFFRATTIEQGMSVLAGLPRAPGAILEPGVILSAFAGMNILWYELGLAFLALATLIAVDFRLHARDEALPALIATLPSGLRWTTYYVVGAAIAGLGVFGRQQFIYFQF